VGGESLPTTGTQPNESTKPEDPALSFVYMDSAGSIYPTLNPSASATNTAFSAYITSTANPSVIQIAAAPSGSQPVISDQAGSPIPSTGAANPHSSQNSYIHIINFKWRSIQMFLSGLEIFFIVRCDFFTFISLLTESLIFSFCLR
jgi:hypothetical protein